MTYNDPLKRTVIITGAAGFIGSATVAYLNDLGMENLLLVDDLKEGNKWRNLVGKRFLDCISKDTLLEYLAALDHSVDAIIHLGACSSTLETNASYLMENNYRYTLQLASWALENNVRFIYASSAATYGDGKLGFSDDHNLISSLQPLNVYGYSKQIFDQWALRTGALSKIVGLKYFNVFGPNENHKGPMSSMVYKMLPLIQSQGCIKLYKSSDLKQFAHGEQKRDFIYVKDAVRMTCSFLENTEAGIFNIGSGEATSWNRLASAVFAALGSREQIEYIDMPEDLARQYQSYTCADMTKYRTYAGIAASDPPCHYTIEESVKDYVQNYLLQDKRW